MDTTTPKPRYIRWLTALLSMPCLISIPMAQAAAESAPTAKAEKIIVGWRNKPPYHYLENGGEHGFLLERSKQVFAHAGVEAEHVEMPSKRIWQNFSTGMHNFCSIGWYRLPERESLVNFSLPFHIDRPHTVVSGPAALAAVKAHTSLSSLLQDKSLSLGVVDGVSYGPELDAMMAHAANKIEKRTVEPLKIMRMAAADRFSFVIIDREDWEWSHTHEEGLGKLHNIDFADIPPGLTRYIVCSKDVSHDTMARLNRVIESLKIGAPDK